MAPQVSIVIVNYNHPEFISKCLQTIHQNTPVPHEVIVVDNASDEHTRSILQHYREINLIDRLLLEPKNWLFSEGNNIGVRNADPASEYVLLLNSDVAIKDPSWLVRMLQWMNGTIQHRPTIWDFHPTNPAPGPYDIISYGWSHDANVAGRVRPEGWCILYRKQWYREMSQDFPWHYGFEQSVCQAVRDGARCGVLFNYAPYVVHREGGSYGGPVEINNIGSPDLTAWFSDIHIESLDFTLGPNEHDSYLEW